METSKIEVIEGGSFLKYLQKYRLILIMFGILMLCTNADAADPLYRFMHNDHDALIIGEITGIHETGVRVRVEKSIVSAENLNETHPKKQLSLSEATVISPFGYEGFYNEDSSCIVDPSVGDYVLLSLKKTGNKFEIAWGAYKVDSLNNENLSVVLPDNSQVWSRMEAAAVKVFVNNDGKITEFAFDGDSKTVYAGEEGVVIFHENNDTGENSFEDRNKIPTKDDSSIGIIGGADGPTAIYVSGNPIKAMMVPIIVFAAIIFAIGFAIGYIVKGKRVK